MNNSRYTNLKVLKKENGIRYIETPNYISLTPSDNDIIIRYKDGDSSTSLAYKFYNDPKYYWIILKANNISIDSQFVLGQKIRIPRFISNIIGQS